MERMFLAPGFRFHPTEVELILYYLKRKIMGKRLHVEAVEVIDLYKFDPWDLPEKSCLKSRDLEWYFFCPKYRKYSNGLRANRSTEHGYWKTTGRDKPICHNSQRVGMRKTLVFHEGRAPQGRSTNWVMYEYRLEDKYLVDAGIIQATYVICKIFEKSGPGPKNGEQYGAPYREEDWEDDDISIPVADPGFSSLAQDDISIPVGDPGSSSLAQAEEHPPLREDNDIVSILAVFDRDDGAAVSNGNDCNQNLGQSNVDERAPLEGFAIYNGLEDLGSPSDLKTNGLHFHSTMETEYTLDPKLQEDDTSFLELNDLDYPMDYTAETNGCITLVDSYPCYNDLNNLEGFCGAGLPASGLSMSHSLYPEGSEVEAQLPTFPKDKGSEGDGSHVSNAAICNLTACSGREAEERGIKYFQQTLGRDSAILGSVTSGLR
ncbi:NAC domain-containing protein 82-like isoform X2 [Macadamia integrifolia]|uniref:NAC domain-containing protein 82-like isoform X2 n=1 Tax=Macadamia integrifolia TaxID=60698 RepID=UPI001C4FE4F6|nr:NAC domain-containing protein 82-like isoform X2 [Macadamia integrifolia]